MRIEFFDNRFDRDIRLRIKLMVESPEPWTVAKGRKLLELVDYLEASGPEPRVFGYLLLEQLHLTAKGVSVQIEVDWPDYGPVEDGQPVMHFRITRKPSDSGSRLSAELRTRSLNEVEHFVLQAFGWQ